MKRTILIAIVLVIVIVWRHIMWGKKPYSEVRSEWRFVQVFHDRIYAESLLEILKDLVKKYGFVTKADLNDIAGLSTIPADEKSGWIDLKNSHVSSVEDGYILVLPQPAVLD